MEVETTNPGTHHVGLSLAVLCGLAMMAGKPCRGMLTKRSSGLATVVSALFLAGFVVLSPGDAGAVTSRSRTAALAQSQTGRIRRSVLDAITARDPAVCADLFTDHGIVDDANALYVRGFNGPITQDPAQARNECEQVHATNATPAPSLVKIKKLSVRRNTAHASVEVGVGGTYQVGLVRSGSTWQIDSVS